ncbi:MAG: hypothetical protein ACFFDX_00200 [Candidatus Odinarchaeota archaeon]
MINCYLCKREIKIQDLRKSFQITLGNITNGKFNGEKVFFYHKECLLKDVSRERKIAPQIT